MSAPDDVDSKLTTSPAPEVKDAVRPAPRALDRAVLPRAVLETLRDDETVLYWAQPIRHPMGIGVWMIFALGPIFFAAGIGAFEETVRRGIHEAAGIQFGGAGLLAVGSLLMAAFGVLFCTWPLLSAAKMRRSHAVVTDQRVFQVVAARKSGTEDRVFEWPVTTCDAANVVRKRGQSATLVLREHTEMRKSDERMVYRWDALHGLPRAREALRAIHWVQHQALAEVRSTL